MAHGELHKFMTVPHYGKWPGASGGEFCVVSPEFEVKVNVGNNGSPKSSEAIAEVSP